MDKMPINYKSLIINNIKGSITFLKAKIVNITLLLLLLLQGSVSSCEHVSEAELRQAADSANNDSTLWRSLQGFWRVEAIHYDLDTTFFAPEDPNFIEIHGDTIRQYYLVNAPKTPVSVPNMADLEEIFENIITFHSPDSLFMDDLPLEYKFSADSQRVELRTAEVALRARRVAKLKNRSLCEIKETKFDEVN